MRGVLLALFIFAIMAGCESATPGPPVVVYAAYPEGPYLVDYLAEFTAATGIPATVVFGDSSRHLAMLLENRGYPPADVYITREIEHLWRAADRGALRPIQSRNIAAVPDFLQDGDKLWAALNYQFTVIASRSPPGTAWPHSYVSLADPEYRGQLCLSSAKLPVNRALVAMLVDELGLQQTERVVRGWMLNLASSPFATDRELLAAIEAGECRFGLLSGWVSGWSYSSQADATVQTVDPQPGYVEIEGVGIARHARSPESAQQLVDWLLSKAANQQHAKAVRAYSVYQQPRAGVSKKNVGIAGWRDDEARLLAARAAYQ